MKKILILSLLSVMCFGCKKKYCWQCDVTKTLNGKDTVYKLQICDKTKSEISDMEYDLSHESTHYALPGTSKAADCSK